MTDIPPRLCLWWQNYHLIIIIQIQRLLENRKIIVSKPFVHTKWQIYIKNNNFENSTTKITSFSPNKHCACYFICLFLLQLNGKIILLYKFVKFGVNKRFWHYNFPVFQESSSLENENRVTILHPRRSRGGKSVTRFSIF